MSGFIRYGVSWTWSQARHKHLQVKGAARVGMLREENDSDVAL